MMTVTKRLRFEILRRDNHTCRYCGASAPDVKLHVDHVVPTALGGNDEPTNLVTACADCNSGKSATPADAAIVAEVSEKAAVFAEHYNRALEEWRNERAAMSALVQAFDEAWGEWCLGGDNSRKIPRDTDWEQSVERWIAAGLTVDDLASFIPGVMKRSNIEPSAKWKYFCGVVWRQLRDISDRAAGGG